MSGMRASTRATTAVLFAINLLTGCTHLPTPSPSPLDASRYAQIDIAVESFIARRQMPGAVFWLERNGVSYQKAFGRQTFEADANVTNLNTVFDAASLTKVIATAPSIMLLIEEGKVALDTPLIQYFPECSRGGKDAISVRHLLTHTSGLAAGLPSIPSWRGEEAAFKLACAQAVTHPRQLLPLFGY